MATRSIKYVVGHGLWRAVAAVLILTLPVYVWLLFYPFATGVHTQSAELIMGNAPVLATYVVPLLAAVWVLGFRGLQFVVVLILGIIIARLLPFSVANQLLPGSHLQLAVALVLVAIGVRVFMYWRDYYVHHLPIDRYSVSAGIVVGVGALILINLLLPSSVVL